MYEESKKKAYKDYKEREKKKGRKRKLVSVTDDEYEIVQRVIIAYRKILAFKKGKKHE